MKFHSFLTASAIFLTALSFSACSNSSTDISTDSSANWTQDHSISGLVFSYPSELSYQAGGDTDTSSFSWISGDEGETPYFGILSSALMKCPFENSADCNLGDLVSATPQEVFDATVQSMESDAFYTALGDVKVGNGSGKGFDLKEKNADGSTRQFILIQTDSGVYTVSDSREVGAGDALWDEFLASFVFDL